MQAHLSCGVCLVGWLAVWIYGWLCARERIHACQSVISCEISSDLRFRLSDRPSDRGLSGCVVSRLAGSVGVFCSAAAAEVWYRKLPPFALQPSIRTRCLRRPRSEIARCARFRLRRAGTGTRNICLPLLLNPSAVVSAAAACCCCCFGRRENFASRLADNRVSSVVAIGFRKDVKVLSI